MSSATNSKTNTATKKEKLEISELETVVITSASKKQLSASKVGSDFTMQTGSQSIIEISKKLAESTVPDIEIQELIPVRVEVIDSEQISEKVLAKCDSDTFQISQTMQPNQYVGVSQLKSS